MSSTFRQLLCRLLATQGPTRVCPANEVRTFEIDPEAIYIRLVFIIIIKTLTCDSGERVLTHHAIQALLRLRFIIYY